MSKLIPTKLVKQNRS